MGIDAHYVVRFASADAAEEALSKMGVRPEPLTEHTWGDYPADKPSYRLNDAESESFLVVQQYWKVPELVSVSSWFRYLNSDLFLHPERGGRVDSRDVSRALNLIEELDFLLNIPGLRTGTFHYGMEIGEMESITTVVDVAFLAALWKFADDNWSLVEK